ncbi:MAG TPA: hypothetical protein VF141_04280 [Chryseolinea sp.]
MHLFRGKFTRYAVILLMGLTFLNVSFLQMEIKYLRQVTGDGLSLSLLAEILEEKAGAGENEDEQNDKESDLIFHASAEHSYHSNLYSQNIKWALRESSLHRGYFEKFSPPPEG